LPAELAVLTENALQGAAGEKNRPGASLPDQGRFFPEVLAGPGDFHPRTFPAVSPLVPQTVHTAVARTEAAIIVQFVHSDRQLTRGDLS